MTNYSLCEKSKWDKIRDEEEYGRHSHGWWNGFACEYCGEVSEANAKATAAERDLYRD